jgi:hypothetical protein
MADTPTQLVIGTPVECRDGDCGEMTRVVIDPVTRTVTHLVVNPDDRGPGRLVPVELVEAADEAIRLGCDRADFDRFEDAEETRFLPGTGDSFESGQVLAWPSFALATGGAGGGMYDFGANAALPVTYDKLPAGEIGVRRGERVHATDGDIGRVQGLVVDPADHSATHVLLDEGHLWGRKQVAIPVALVAGVPEGIHLTVSKEHVADLPPVDLDRGTQP